MDVRMTLKPAIIPWLVGIEIAQNDINLPFVAVGSNDPIHEIQKLRAAASFLMAASIAHKSEGFLSFEQCTGKPGCSDGYVDLIPLRHKALELRLPALPS